MCPLMRSSAFTFDGYCTLPSARGAREDRIPRRVNRDPALSEVESHYIIVTTTQKYLTLSITLQLKKLFHVYYICSGQQHNEKTLQGPTWCLAGSKY